LNVLGLGADVPGQQARQADNDFAGLVLVDQLFNRFGIGQFVTALEDDQWAGDDAQRVRHGHPEPLIADVETEDAFKHSTVTL
jgi:hypothetical protein